MMNQSRPHTLSLAAILILTQLGLPIGATHANPNSLYLAQQSSRPRVVLKVPNNGAPGSPKDPPASGGNRPGCLTPSKPLTVLAPGTNWGETTAARPTLWFYVPYSTGRLTLRLEDEKARSQVGEPVNLEAQGTPGIVSITLPQTMPPLVVGQRYRWRLYLFCDADASQSGFLQVDGVIVRRAARANLTGLSPRDRLVRYAADGLWYDALTELAILRRQDPTNPDLKADWANLLTHQSVRLGDVLEEPIVDCCRL